MCAHRRAEPWSALHLPSTFVPDVTSASSWLVRRPRKEKKTVLHGVSGVFGQKKSAKGEMVRRFAATACDIVWRRPLTRPPPPPAALTQVCIMGQSGAGKVSL